MRLIDADELLKQKELMAYLREPDSWFFVPEEENLGTYYMEVNDISFWADEHKADAIPVEWLKNYVHCTLTNSCQDHNIVGWCEQLLNDWSEEKETEHYEKVLEKRK